MMLGTLLKLAGEETTVMLMSDHGFHPDHLRPAGIHASRLAQLSSIVTSASLLRRDRELKKMTGSMGRTFSISVPRFCIYSVCQ